jgi:hypothetical protein
VFCLVLWAAAFLIHHEGTKLQRIIASVRGDDDLVCSTLCCCSAILRAFGVNQLFTLAGTARRGVYSEGAVAKTPSLRGNGATKQSRSPSIGSIWMVAIKSFGLNGETAFLNQGGFAGLARAYLN